MMEDIKNIYDHVSISKIPELLLQIEPTHPQLDWFFISTSNSIQIEFIDQYYERFPWNINRLLQRSDITMDFIRRRIPDIREINNIRNSARRLCRNPAFSTEDLIELFGFDYPLLSESALTPEFVEANLLNFHGESLGKVFENTRDLPGMIKLIPKMAHDYESIAQGILSNNDLTDDLARTWLLNIKECKYINVMNLSPGFLKTIKDKPLYFEEIKRNYQLTAGDCIELLNDTRSRSCDISNHPNIRILDLLLHDLHPIKNPNLTIEYAVLTVRSIRYHPVDVHIFVHYMDIWFIGYDEPWECTLMEKIIQWINHVTFNTTD